MARSCAIIPRVLNNKTGEVVDSKLFKDLLSYTSNREEARKYYLITKDESFIKNWNPKLELDDNNEPTLKSLLDKTNLSDVINDQKIIKKLNRDIGAYKTIGSGEERLKLWVNNDQNYQKLLQKAIDFNRNSPFRDNFVAKVIKVADDESNRIFINTIIERKNKMNSIDAEQMEYNANLNEKIRDILAEHGVSIGALTELERRQGISGVADFEQAKQSAEGLIELIRLANSIKGEKALPEEFAHFVIEAMGDNPLMTRLLNVIKDNNLVSEILGDEYDTYNEAYNSDELLLLKEAAGKLLAKHLLQNAEIPNKPYKNLLQRFIDSIKRFFKNINATDIEKAMLEADKNYQGFAKDILDGKLRNDLNVKNINFKDKLFNLDERVSRDKQVLQNIIRNEATRLAIYKKRNPKSKFEENQRELIEKLEISLAKNEELEGIYTFLETAIKELNTVSKRLVESDKASTSIEDKGSVLRDVRNYIFSYKNTIKDIRHALSEEKIFDDNRYEGKIQDALNTVSNLIEDLEEDFYNSTGPSFAKFLAEYREESAELPTNAKRDKSILEQLDIADNDVTLFNRFLDSMADSQDEIIRISDHIIKQKKEVARQETIETAKQLKKAGLELEKAGYKDTEWMFEKDDEGNKTGNYISEINQGLYKKRRDAKMKELDEKYGDNPMGEQAKAYIKEKNEWFNENTRIVDGVRQPDPEIYENKFFTGLKETDPRKIFYNTVMKIKEEIDEQLPDNYTYLTNTIKIRKDLLERVKNSGDPISMIKQIRESLKDATMRRNDDTDFGDVKNIIMDFEGNEVMTLPIYYTHLSNGQSANDISTDVVSTMIAYVAMGNEYKELSNIVDIMEIGRILMKERNVTQTQGGKVLKEKFSSAGHKIEKTLTKKGNETMSGDAFEDLLDMQMYQRYMKDEGTFGKSNVDVAKTANNINKLTSLNSLALNLLAGISNVTTGAAMMLTEGMSKEYFSLSDILKADRIYIKELPTLLGEIGSRTKTSKLALWIELFDSLQDFEKEIKDTKFNRKGIFSKMFGTQALFFMNNAGEHWMQTRTSLSLGNAYKMKSPGPNGKIVSLWDAMEVQYLDPNNKKLGARLVVKPGYTKEDGTAFTQEDIFRFTRKSAGINQRLNGVYNKADRDAFQKLAIGRMAMMFRKWMRKSYVRRYGRGMYNYDLEQYTEGYYRSMFRFLGQVAKELKEGRFALITNYKNLTNHEKANIKRALTELTTLLILMAFLGLKDWPDDKNRPWLANMFEYQVRRLYTEVGSQTPGPQSLNELLRITKSPAAGVNTIEKVLDLIGLFNPFNYESVAGEDALIKSGRYEGKSRATKLFFESPLLPMNKTVYRGLHPEEGIPFFKQ